MNEDDSMEGTSVEDRNNSGINEYGPAYSEQSTEMETDTYYNLSPNTLVSKLLYEISEKLKSKYIYTQSQ